MKRAVILAGGGARGPYQVGVWQALQELGIDYQIVTGSSVGALNGALMVQGDLPLARALWEQITPSEVVQLPDLSDRPLDQKAHLFKEFLSDLTKRGGLDITPLEQKVRALVDEEKLRASPVEFGLVTTTWPTLHPVMLCKHEIPQGELVDYLLASAAWFPIFSTREIDGTRYVDGAYSDNMPTRLAVECGAEELIAVELHAAGIIHRYREDLPVTHIHCYWDLGKTVEFSPARSARSMQLGYQDALKAYRRLEGHAYAFHPGETARNAQRMLQIMGRVHRATGVDIFSRYQRLPGLSRVVRRRHSHFLRPRQEAFGMGRAITTAAEITGELLKLPPDQIYALETFNHILLGRWQQRHREHSPHLSVVSMLHRMLRHAARNGAIPDAFWGAVTISPRELIAASYLMALEELEHPGSHVGI